MLIHYQILAKCRMRRRMNWYRVFMISRVRITSKYQNYTFDQFKVRIIPQDKPVKKNGICKRNNVFYAKNQFIKPPAVLISRSKNGQMQYKTILAVGEFSPTLAIKINPKSANNTVLKIQSKFLQFCCVKAQVLKQQIIISGQVRIQTPKLQLAIDIGIDKSISRFTFFGDLRLKAIITIIKTSKNGKYTTLFKYMNAIVIVQPTITSNKNFLAFSL